MAQHLRVVVWNMAANSVARDRAIQERGWKYLADLEPDLALVQEVGRPPAWAYDRWNVVMDDVRRFGSAIVAAQDLGLQRWSGPSESRLESDHYLATATMALSDADRMIVASVHAPARLATEADLEGREPAVCRRPSHRRDPGKPEGPYLTDAAFCLYRSRLEGHRFLIGGDWNVSRQLDRPSKPECAEFFERAAAQGWVEACCPAGVEGRTWFRGTDRPCQLDHVFVDAESRVEAASIDPTPATSDPQLSDHAPMILAVVA